MFLQSAIAPLVVQRRGLGRRRSLRLPPLPRQLHPRPDRVRVGAGPERRLGGAAGEFGEGARRVAEGFGIVVVKAELAQVGGPQAGLDQRLAADVGGGLSVVGHL